jgi:ABC-type branched-subunit amino acid transport system substrate-binding protein
MLIHTLKSLLAAVGTGLLLTAAHPARAADPGIGDSTITLGMSAPFSGPNGAYGKEMREGALAYFAQLNGAGGINGKKVELVTLDDGYETDKTVANTRKLIDENKVFALMAYYGSSPTTEAMKLFSEARPPARHHQRRRQPAQPVNRYMFHLRASYADETEAIVNHLVGWASPTSPCSTRTTASASRARTACRALARHKLKPVAEGSVERNSLQVETAVAQIAKATPRRSSW